MKLSTRSRYGVRMMIDLAAHYGDKPVFLKDIAAREVISEKYLSLIVIPLKSAGLIRAVRGAQGGYLLAREPQKISLRDIVEAVDGVICLVNCVKNPNACDRVSVCPTRDLWSTLGDRISETLAGVTLDQLAKKNNTKKLSGSNTTRIRK